jgi:hypothetical protein
VDRRADVYGLGRLGARLLAAPGTARNDPSMALRQGVPAKVAGVLRTATADRPGGRYPDAAAFGAALAAAIAGTAVPAVHERYDPGRPRGPRQRITAAAGLTLFAAATLAALGSDSVTGRPERVPGAGVDPTGRITVALPAGWRTGGSGWRDEREADGEMAPALWVSPDPDRWSSDPAVPGAFVGLSRAVAARITPADFVALHGHRGCVAAPVRTVQQGGIRWVVAAFTSCSAGKATIVEAAGVAPDGAGLVYLQIAPPANSGPEFVDALLAGVRVRR